MGFPPPLLTRYWKLGRGFCGVSVCGFPRLLRGCSTTVCVLQMASSDSQAFSSLSLRERTTIPGDVSSGCVFWCVAVALLTAHSAFFALIQDFVFLPVHTRPMLHRSHTLFKDSSTHSTCISVCSDFFYMSEFLLYFKLLICFRQNNLFAQNSK